MVIPGLGVHHRRSMDSSVAAYSRGGAAGAVGADGGGVPPAAAAAAAAPAALPSLADTDTAAASADEVIAVLAGRNFGKTSAAEKKRLLKLVVAKKQEVIAKASTACGAMMSDTLRTLIPDKEKTVVALAYSNKQVATLMFHLHSFFRGVRLVGRSSSTAASAAPSTAPTTWRQAMARIVELTDQAIAVANADKEDKTNAQWLVLLSATAMGAAIHPNALTGSASGRGGGGGAVCGHDPTVLSVYNSIVQLSLRNSDGGRTLMGRSPSGGGEDGRNYNAMTNALLENREMALQYIAPALTLNSDASAEVIMEYLFSMKFDQLKK